MQFLNGIKKWSYVDPYIIAHMLHYFHRRRISIAIKTVNDLRSLKLKILIRKWYILSNVKQISFGWKFSKRCKSKFCTFFLYLTFPLTKTTRIYTYPQHEILSWEICVGSCSKKYMTLVGDEIYSGVATILSRRKQAAPCGIISGEYKSRRLRNPHVGEWRLVKFITLFITIRARVSLSSWMSS